MTLRLYNTLTKEKDELNPLFHDPATGKPHVRMYVCGPTVYDFAHIGNARPVIAFDVLYRLLRHVYGPDHVTYVRNITDVDDKINARAAVDHPDLPLNEAIRLVTEKTDAQFQADVAALGCLPPTEQPRATEHIDGMKAMIERLVARGVAYVAEGHVLFSPSAMDALNGKLPRYGALARRSLDEMLAGARVDVAPYKKEPMDFVLWKPSADNEPGWPSPAGIEGRGRPGWHIECSAMSMAKLLEPFGGGLSCDDPQKNTFDIHGGGIDLVFPHHENEIAQSCCAFGSSRMANIWMHNGFLQVEGEKMSKSLGNFVTIRELLDEWPGDVLRMVMLQTHYREPIDWTYSKCIAASAELYEWSSLIGAEFALMGEEPDFPHDSALIRALSEDINTPAALAELRAYYKSAKGGSLESRALLAASLKLIGFRKLDQPGLFRRELSSLNAESYGVVEAVETANKLRAAIANTAPQTAISQLTSMLEAPGFRLEIGPGSRLLIVPASGDPEIVIKQKIAARLEARRAKNFAEADRIRAELDGMGIALKDAKDPATGEIVTTWEVKR